MLLSICSDKKIAVIGLGYVGLPLAIEFGKKQNVVGFDIDRNRIDELSSGKDSTLEMNQQELQEAVYLKYSENIQDLVDRDVYIITVPTPVDESRCPDLNPLIKVSEMLGEVVSKGNILIYESTVYPGATEEVCIPAVERKSGLKFNEDFFVGYSPERINPGDKDHRVTNILKVTSGSTPEIAEEVDQLYRSIIVAGTYKAHSIRVAEASKVIENVQRDVNIAIINELAIIFDKLGIDTLEVLEAAGTKWNFLPFRPGLVGGHCIGVDPYYLAHKAQAVGYHPEIILASRRLNDTMGEYIVSRLLKEMFKKGIQVLGAKILVMGLSFKENCPDLRNTRVIDILAELTECGVEADVYDPWVCEEEAKSKYNIQLISSPEKNFYDAIIIAISHREFRVLGADSIREYTKSNSVIYDLKYTLSAEEADIRL
ncbi:Vi polysaccharide biosynthesis protein VipA/TviB [Candidatus Endobugula sertula]|uniref:Vi polysaccharide biosynthesis protein VipA/TviB n=1 Tax=Candidatus Endobugula sertula TaxID=62101 RepID=A0A1D2QNG4_9GAMM|nr:Vi polysaccharide biosynthesis protein VipA/TviB [Candidatus Endobugula sertula]